MTRDQLVADSAEFKGKKDAAYIHAELKNGQELSLFLNGGAMAVEAVAYEIINHLAEEAGVPLEFVMAKMMMRHHEMQDMQDDKLEY